jgi:Ni,Fe-hydrogenase I cytochrome b subunit
MLKNYYKPTPIKWRKLGDALLAVSVTITGFAMYENVQWVALTALITGVIGKFLTNFFKEDDTKTRKQRRGRKNSTRVS